MVRRAPRLPHQFRVRRQLLRARSQRVHAGDRSLAGSGPAATLKDPGLRHLAIAVDDFDAACEQLKRQGTNFLAEPYENQGNRLVFFTDADGNFLHLIQRPNPLP